MSTHNDTEPAPHPEDAGAEEDEDEYGPIPPDVYSNLTTGAQALSAAAMHFNFGRITYLGELGNTTEEINRMSRDIIEACVEHGLARFLPPIGKALAERFGIDVTDGRAPDG